VDPEAPTPPDPVMDLQPDATDLGLQTELTADAVADDPQTGIDPNAAAEALQEGDAHSGLEVFGVMYLTPEQIARGAQLTGESEQTIRVDLAANIDAAAAVIAELAQQHGIDMAAQDQDLDAWGPVIAQFVGADGDAEVTHLAVSAVKDLYLDGFNVVT